MMCLRLTLVSIIALCITVEGFSPTPLSTASTAARASSVLQMSSAPPPELKEDNYLAGGTERLLLERKRRNDQGLVQEMGRTVKNDGLDGIRAVVWNVYFAAQNFIFPALAIGLFSLTALNLAGYGYYVGDDGFHIDTLYNIQQDARVQLLEAENAARLAAGN